MPVKWIAWKVFCNSPYWSVTREIDKRINVNISHSKLDPKMEDDERRVSCNCAMWHNLRLFVWQLGDHALLILEEWKVIGMTTWRSNHVKQLNNHDSNETRLSIDREFTSGREKDFSHFSSLISPVSSN